MICEQRRSVVACDQRRQALSGHLRFLEWLGKPLAPGARVLDFGCGIGQSVDILLGMGYDVHGRRRRLVASRRLLGQELRPGTIK